MEAQNLSELFSTRIFRTPDYQRGYAWSEKQLSELWDDLEDIHIDENEEYKKHYTGTIFLKEISASSTEKWLKGVKFYDVVDGQQRLTTISILLFELLNATEIGYAEESKVDLLKKYIATSNMSGNSKIYRFSYLDTNQNYKFLLREIFEDNKEILPVTYKNHYTENLQFAKDFFKEKILSISPEEREVVYQKLTTSFLFDIRTIENDLDVQAVFETMNNRGKPLSTLEKLKNRLIYLTAKLQCSQEDIEMLRKNINDAWGNIYTWLAQNPKQVLNEDVFLSAHLSLYRKPEEYTFSETMAEKKVFEMFCNKAEKYKEETVSYTKIEDYILKLSELAPIWFEIHNSKSQLINKILVMDSRKEVKIFLTALINEKTDKQEDIFGKIEKILFRNRVPGIWLMDERTMANWAREIYNQEKSLIDILNEIEELLARPINNIDIINGFKYLFTYERGAKGFHRWWNLKYFLFEYENWLKIKARETNDKVTLSDYDETTIEHIMPQHFWNNWQTEMNEVTNSLADENQIVQTRKVMINTLGNLTILKNGKNSSLGDKSWDVKKERFSTGSYNEIAISKCDTWTKDSISGRGKEMLIFLQTKVNGLVFSDSDIENILFFDNYIIDAVYGKSLSANAID
ncbi:DUF262 domain-containing protein [Dysgonomonas sp. 520]|uniref:DUF262 domain-containing protein n=1 Tax=Dysgonomonas sp. 520 TaxID=2302931 RepID=UPI0013D5E37A|nr:DUF262 domain-containing protein [Dysgonomonas sp. 520]NDW09363.1 DUF262 domain-containing protein [Dysgonomonas sp. 520]